MKKKYFLLSSLFLKTLCIGFFLLSCNGTDEPYKHKITEDTSYYLVGEVYSEDKALEGVAVKSSDGTETLTDESGSFSLKLSKKGDHKISFSKTGYVTVSSDILFKTDATISATRFLNQVLVKKNASVRVDPDKDTEIKIENAGVNLFIPAGALKETTDISVTPYIQGNNKAPYLFLLSLNLEPDGLKFDKPLELFFSKPMGDGDPSIVFKHLVNKNDVLKDEGTVNYDSEKEGFKIELTSFSDHMLALQVSLAAASPGDVLINSFETNNLSRSTLIYADPFNFNYFVGWKLDIAPYNSLADWVYDQIPSRYQTTANAITIAANIMLSVTNSGPNPPVQYNGSGGGNSYSVPPSHRVVFDVYQTTNTTTIQYLDPISRTLLIVPIIQYTGFHITTTYFDHKGGIVTL